MKRSFLLFSAGCVLFSGGSLAFAQMPPGPPKLLQIFREEVKPGRAAAHEKVETG